MLILPPYGDHAARPVSSYKTTRTLGAPCGARFSSYGVQSALESRTSSLITPSNCLSLISTSQSKCLEPEADADDNRNRQPAAVVVDVFEAGADELIHLGQTADV